MKQVSVSIDFFGVASNEHLRTLVNQSSNNRLRKTAFTNLFRFAKAAKLIPFDAVPVKVEIAVDKAGQQSLQFVYTYTLAGSKAASANVEGLRISGEVVVSAKAEKGENI